MPESTGINLDPAPRGASQYFVRTRDGVRLATDVYLPDGEGPFPAILVRLPYDKSSRYVFMSAVAQRSTAAGYALVVQDVRGKHGSEGDALGPVTEAFDGYDTLSWIESAEWSDGRVGMFGDSYYGFTQYAAASTGHRALRAIVPRVTSTRIGDTELVEEEGVRDIPWAVGAAYLLQAWTGPLLNELEPDWSKRPLTAAFDQRFDELGSRSVWYDSVTPHHVPSRIFPDGRPHTVRPVPVLQCIGWWDTLSIAHMRDVAEFAATPGWDAAQYLWIDSIDHENYHIDIAGAVGERDHATSDAALETLMSTYFDPARRFFDVFVKGAAPASELPRVQWHLAHSGYRTAESWPPTGAVSSSLHLAGLETMTTHGGRLQVDVPSGAERGRWRFDPERPVPSPAKNSWSYLLEYPDEREAAKLPDVAVFDSEPFAEHLDLAGPVALWLRVASTASSADVFARLLDVAPDGSAHLIVRGQAEFIAPDAVALRRIELGHTGYRMRVGHRLRLALASSDFPEYVLNPGDGSNRWLAVDLEPAEHTLLTDGSVPARLDLTVLRP